MPKFPKKKLAQAVLQTLIAFDINNVVVSPGSRNAPLTLGCVNHPEIEPIRIVDERSAAFFALGMAQRSQRPVALICTSGSALLNYYPALAEAYYSGIPLIVLSSDRPGRLIDVGDGQTIRQAKVFSEHILFESSLEDSGDLEEQVNTLREAFSISIERQGPVHLNLAFDEPLYETVDSLYEIEGVHTYARTTKEGSLMSEDPIPLNELEAYAKVWNGSTRKMVLIGVHQPDDLLQTQLNHLIEDPSVLVLTETMSNVRNEKFIARIDQLIFSLSEEELEELRPEVLLTFGGMVVSKKIKQFLRRFQPDHHWHVDPFRAMDTFHCLERHFEISKQLFFSQFFFLTQNRPSEYQAKWVERSQMKRQAHRKFLEQAPYSDLKVFETLFKNIPNDTDLQLANSSVVRYAQLFAPEEKLRISCNRGASGIDGSTSTALGAAMASDLPTLLISGDLSFFYDSNAFWVKDLRPDFRVIVVNNGGGGIFRILPGPERSEALEFFETPHGLDASHICKMHGVNYLSARDMSSLQGQLSGFFEPSNGPRLLEIFTPSEKNADLLRGYFEFLSGY